MKNYLDYKLEENGLFQSRFDDGGYVVWRPLPWDEYKKYREARYTLGQKIDLDIEQSVYEKCVIFSTYDTPPPQNQEFTPEQIREWLRLSRDEQPAGVIPTVVKTIMYTSGAASGPEIIQQLNVHRPNIYNIEDHMVILICKAFPAYRPEDVESMDWQMLLKRAAQAEAILNQPIILHDPEAEHKKMVQAEKAKLQKEISEALSMEKSGKNTIDNEIEKDIEEAKKAHQERSKQAAKLRHQYFREKGMI